MSIYRQVSRGLDGLARTRRSPNELYPCTSSLLCCTHCKRLGHPYLFVVQACFGKHCKLRRPTTLCDENNMPLPGCALPALFRKAPAVPYTTDADAPNARSTLIADEPGRRCRLTDSWANGTHACASAALGCRTLQGPRPPRLTTASKPCKCLGV